MARQPRVEYPGAIHHVMSQGNDGIAIFIDDVDRQLFLDLVGEEVVRSGWIVHDYCLMTNHYHLAMETPERTLATGMQRLLGRYVQRFNKRHGRKGHLMGSRYKNVLVEREAYFSYLSRYIALNPVEAGMVARPEEYRWSSYCARLGLVPVPQWLTIDGVFAAFSPNRDAQLSEYRAFVEEGIGAPGDLMDEVRAQMYLGGAAWIEGIQKVLDEKERGEDSPRAQVHPGRPELEDVVEAVAQTFDTTPEKIASGRGTLERRAVAYLAFEEGLVPLRRIAARLGVTSAGGISSLVSRFRGELRRDGELGELVDICRRRMRRRPAPFTFPRLRPPLTARRYHRAPPQSRR